MAVLTHFLAASDGNQMLEAKEVEAFVADLLREQMVQFPVAILVGEARNMVFQAGRAEYVAHLDAYIVPNHPEGMLDYVGEQNPSSNLLWYSGSDEQTFFDVLKKLPLGEKDCCLCFSGLHVQLKQMGWNGATIYLLTHPFPMEFCDPIGTDLVTLVDRPLVHYFILSSLMGAGMDQEANPLEPILKRYFGPHLLTRETQ
ncbi:MAG TPA: hypothetical protein VFV38_42415 [Ktedonobacteraceae bacterium]|nr:hypothetical protein [Ktedonobacteraceae bacterium]